MADPSWTTVIVTFIGGSAFGAIASAIITQRMIGSREARDRKNAFRGHLGRWLGAIHQASDSELSTVHDRFCAEHIMGYCALLSADVLRRRKFRRLCEAVSTTKKDSSNYRVQITERIGALMDFL